MSRMKSKKILFYADTVFGFGGVQRVLAVIAQALSDRNDITILSTDKAEDMSRYGYDKSNIQFKYISYNTKRDAEYYMCKCCSYIYKKYLPKTRITSRLYSHSFFLPKYKKKLIKNINSGGYDVVIGVHAFFSLHLASVRRKLNAPMVIGWMHNSFSALFDKENPYLPGLKSFFRWEMRNLNKIIVLSNSDKHLFETNLNLSSDVIYNPLTLNPRGKGGIEHHKFLSVGRFSPRHKGFDILIEAFALFAKSNAEWTLEIVGEGDEESLYRQIIANHGLEARVAIKPFTTNIQKHYANASIYVLSSRWEGFGLVLVEAMAHGLPIIASDIPVARELLCEKGVADLFRSEDVADLANKMHYIAEGKNYTSLSSNALEYSGRFSVKEISEKWEHEIS